MILLTGATGLLGGHTLYALLQKHDRVAALKREHSSTETLREIFSFYTDDPDELLKRIEWRNGDMLDQPSLDQALEGISCVVNCAAIVSFDPKDRKKLITNNVEGTRNLVNVVMSRLKDQETKRPRDLETKGPGDRERFNDINCAHGLPVSQSLSLLHVSSTAALGDSPGRDPDFRIDEETPRDSKRQHNGYSESKWRSEQVVWNAIEGERRKEKGGREGEDKKRRRGEIGNPEQLSEDYHQSPVTSHQSPVTSHQSPVTSHQSPVTNHQSSVTNFPAIILNPGIILGPGQWNKGSSLLFKQAWQGLKFYPYGGTGYVDVRDMAEIIVQIVEMWKCGNVLSQEPITLTHSHIPQPQSLTGQRYCLVGANLRYKEFFDLVTNEFGKPNPHIYAGKFLSGLAWRADTLRARLAGRYPLLTRETAESAQRISFYSSQKIQHELGFSFRKVEDTLDWICSLYKNKRLRPETRDQRLKTRDGRPET